MDDTLSEKRVFSNFVKLYNAIVSELTVFFQENGITITQFDVLEAVVNVGEKGLPLLKIGKRLLSHKPDVTRIVDRLENMGLITRMRDIKDRRVVFVKPTKTGIKLYEKINPLLIEIHRYQFGTLSKSELKEFNELVVKMSEKADSSMKKKTAST